MLAFATFSVDIIANMFTELHTSKFESSTYYTDFIEYHISETDFFIYITLYLACGV